MTDRTAATGDDAIGLVVLYRWRRLPGRDADFIAAWREVTEVLLGYGSFGSRLHRGDDGLWYGDAQWPDEATRAQAATQAAVPADTRARMRACIAESLPETRLAPVADLLRLSHNRPA